MVNFIRHTKKELIEALKITDDELETLSQAYFELERKLTRAEADLAKMTKEAGYWFARSCLAAQGDTIRALKGEQK
jgi:hypothetical protein